MQWDKVKNVLIGILLAVNLFLVGSLGAKLWQNWERVDELEANLRTLTAGYGVSLSASFELPQDKVLPILSLDRSRTDEEAVAQAMLGEDAERTEREDGTVRFENDAGYVEWRADGKVRADWRFLRRSGRAAGVCRPGGSRGGNPFDGCRLSAGSGRQPPLATHADLEDRH